MRTLVTGANRGIGLEFVRQLAARGDQVIAVARDLDGAKDLAALAEQQKGVRLVQCDITSDADIGALTNALRDDMNDSWTRDEIEDRADFVDVESDIYPDLARYYAQKALEWRDRRLAELAAEEDGAEKDEEVDDLEDDDAE